MFIRGTWQWNETQSSRLGKYTQESAVLLSTDNSITTQAHFEHLVSFRFGTFARPKSADGLRSQTIDVFIVEDQEEITLRHTYLQFCSTGIFN